MRYLLFVALMFVGNVYGQSLSVNHSVTGLSSARDMIEVSFKHDRFGVHYFQNYTAPYVATSHMTGFKNRQTSSFAISYKIIKASIFSGGVILFESPFPTIDSAKMNFIAEINIPIKEFSINIKHISNGFGLWHMPNAGLDTIGIEYRF